jgi:hypothetical protein
VTDATASNELTAACLVSKGLAEGKVGTFSGAN